MKKCLRHPTPPGHFCAGLCLEWSEVARHHLAGTLGAAMMSRDSPAEMGRGGARPRPQPHGKSISTRNGREAVRQRCSARAHNAPPAEAPAKYDEMLLAF